MLRIKGNKVTSTEGWQLEILGRAGLRYAERGRVMDIESEMLTGPSGMAVYQSSIAQWRDGEKVGEAERSRILENVRRAFAEQGFEIEVY